MCSGPKITGHRQWLALSQSDAALSEEEIELNSHCSIKKICGQFNSLLSNIILSVLCNCSARSKWRSGRWRIQHDDDDDDWLACYCNSSLPLAPCIT